MKRFSVIFSRWAERDIFALFRYITAEAGYEIAGNYIARIEAACVALETFPFRGRRRDEIGRGLRTMGFERRVTIVFRVRKSDVLIVRIFYGGQDYEPALRDTSEE